MLKKIFFQIHWFLGITAGLVLAIMGVTGAIYSYDQQILKWINKDSYIIAVQNQPKLSPSQLYTHFAHHHPEIKINSITIAKAADESSTLNIVKEGERRGYNMMVNAYSAEILPEIQGREFFQFIQRLHRYLTLGDFGKQITGASTLMLIFFVLSGIYLRWPKKHSWKQWLFVKPKLKGRNFLWDLHAVIGTWVILFYLMLAMTGLYWSYDWWRDGMFKVMGVERPAMQNNATQNKKNDDPSKQAKANLDQAQIATILNQSWNGFNQSLGRDYSSMTINLPKKNDGKVEFVFLDPVVQHERARNNATYNYQNAQIEKLELYENKKLNEKIMSSMLPVHRGSFFGSVYQFFAAVAALMMPLFFITGWMLYLKRRKQKRLTQHAKLSSNVLHLDPEAQKWHIVYASQTGMAEQIAYNTSSALQQASVPTEVVPLKNCTVQDLNHFGHILFVVSTYGTGEAPDLATNFVKKQMNQTADLSTLKFAVLALGSQEYPESYCVFGHRLQDWLKANAAQPVFGLVKVDNGNKTDLERWYTALANITHKQVNAIIDEKTYDEWQLETRQLLNAESQGEPAYEIILKPLYDQSWKAGDILEVQCGNADELIDAYLQKHALTAESELIETLRYKDLSQDTTDALHTSPNIENLPALPAREYSIASIETEERVRLVIRQKLLANDAVHRLGLGSGWLTQYATLDSCLHARIRTNPSFHLIDDDRPIILIGNGTGIAGLLSLLKQREQLRFGQNWLIFGERERCKDFFYQSQIEAWQQNGHLSHLDLAFSRDQAQRIYVQDKLLEQQQRLKEWIAQDAVIYVCGSIEGMATAVDAVLIEVLGEQQVNHLREQDRYRRDVY